jgi:hypothetical protein
LIVPDGERAAVSWRSNLHPWGDSASTRPPVSGFLAAIDIEFDLLVGEEDLGKSHRRARRFELDRAESEPAKGQIASFFGRQHRKEEGDRATSSKCSSLRVVAVNRGGGLGRHRAGCDEDPTRCGDRPRLGWVVAPVIGEEHPFPGEAQIGLWITCSCHRPSFAPPPQDRATSARLEACQTDLPSPMRSR